jgi:hypothetical protein
MLTPEAAEEMPIRRTTWISLIEQIDDLGDVTGGTYGFNAMLFFLGAAVSAGLALPLSTNGARPWFIGAVAVCVVAGVVCYFWHKDMKTKLKADSSRICKQMRQIYDEYPSAVSSLSVPDTQEPSIHTT